MKLIIINSDGGSLRNLPSCRFNPSPNGDNKRAVGKTAVHWTFSARGCTLPDGPWSPTLTKALKHLAEHGYTDLKVVKLDEDIDAKVEEVAYQAALNKGKKGPRNYDEALSLAQKIAMDEFGENADNPEAHPMCKACSRHCKQRLVKVTFYGTCPRFNMKGEIEQPEEEIQAPVISTVFEEEMKEAI